MQLKSGDFRDIFPLAVDLWQSTPKPEHLYVQEETERHFGLDDRTCDDEPIRVSHDGGRPIVLRKIGSMYVQVVRDDKASRGTVIGRQGCIDSLKVALKRCCGGQWSNPRIAEIWSDGAANERRLRRLNAGGRVSVDFVVALARAYGLQPEDLAFPHTAVRKGPGGRRSRAGPFAKLRRERDDAYLKALAHFPVRLHNLTDPDGCDKLARDMLNNRTNVRVVEHWRRNSNLDIEALAAKVTKFQELDQNPFRLTVSSVAQVRSTLSG
jgi:hypothetical protein